ncbi:MAG: hypothetical protein R6U31_06010 [bacterium]
MKKSSFFPVYLIFFVLLFSSTASDSLYLKTIGYYPGNQINGICANDTTLFIASGKSINSFVLSSIQYPDLLGSIEHTGAVYDISSRDNYLFSVCGNDGIGIFDFSDLTSPLMVKHIDVTGFLDKVFIYDNHLYARKDTNSILIYDITDLNNPILSKTLNSSGPIIDYFVDNDFIHIIADSTELYVYDKSTHDRLISFSESNHFLDVSAGDSLVCLAVEDIGLKIYRIQSDSTIAPLSVYSTTGIRNLYIDANTAYIYHNTDDIASIDITHPASPSLLDNLDMISGNAINEIVGNADYLFLEHSNVYSNTSAVVKSDRTNLTRETVYAVPILTEAIIEYNDYIYVFTCFDGVYVFDESGGTIELINHRNWVGSISYIRDVHRHNNTLFAPTRTSKIVMLDISNQSSPGYVGSIYSNTPGYLDTKDDIMFSANGWGGMNVYDISNVSSPSKIGSLQIDDEYVKDITVKDTIAYMAVGGYGLAVANISDYSSPQAIGYCHVPSAGRQIAVRGNTAYLANNALCTIDVTYPAYPYELEHFYLPSFCSKMIASGDHLFINAESSGIFVYDISDIYPVQCAYYRNDFAGKNIYYDDNEGVLYATGTGAGVRKLKFGLSGLPDNKREENRANEFTYQLTGSYLIIEIPDIYPERFIINLFDASGRCLKTVNSESFSQKRRITIDLNEFPPGVYFARLSSDRFKANQKIFYLK